MLECIPVAMVSRWWAIQANKTAILCAKYIYYCAVFSMYTGAPVISGEMEFILLTAINAATPMFTLTCTSTGGPATTVIWTLDGSPQNGGTSQITNQSTATYSNSLTVTGRSTGNYQCSVSNDRNTAMLSLTVEGMSSFEILKYLQLYI